MGVALLGAVARVNGAPLGIAVGAVAVGHRGKSTEVTYLTIG